MPAFCLLNFFFIVSRVKFIPSLLNQTNISLNSFSSPGKYCLISVLVSSLFVKGDFGAERSITRISRTW